MHHVRPTVLWPSMNKFRFITFRCQPTLLDQGSAKFGPWIKSGLAPFL